MGEQVIVNLNRAVWRVIVGPTPRLDPADHQGARQFLSKIQSALDHGGWKHGERVRLHKMKRQWSARAEGRDDVFERYGNKPRGAVVSNEFRETRGSGVGTGSDERPRAGGPADTGQTGDQESTGDNTDIRGVRAVRTGTDGAGGQ